VRQRLTRRVSGEFIGPIALPSQPQALERKPVPASKLALYSAIQLAAFFVILKATDSVSWSWTATLAPVWLTGIAAFFSMAYTAAKAEDRHRSDLWSFAVSVGLAVVLAGLQLAEVIHWPWVFVLAPLWGGGMILFALLVGTVMIFSSAVGGP
jgi:hypothetical protein